MSSRSNGHPNASSALRGVGLLSVGLGLVLAGTLGASASDYDPGRPTSNKQPPTTTPSPPSHRVALGVANQEDRDIAALDAVTAAIGGNTPAIAIVRSAWGDVHTRDFPATTARALVERGITPMIWWTPKGGADTETYSRHHNTIAGQHDDYVRRFARAARDFRDPILLRFAHEANSDYFPWSIRKYDNSEQSYIAMWRRVHGIFRAEGADNVRFVWSVAKEICAGGCNPFPRIYPGDAYVDLMAFSGYNWGAMKDQWISMYDTYRRPAKLLAEVSAKPIIVAETGSSELGGDKAAWIRQGFREVHEKLPRISGIIWTNADLRYLKHPDWRIDSSPASLAAYAEIASLSQFQARSPLAAARMKASARRKADKGDRRELRVAKRDRDARRKAARPSRRSVAKAVRAPERTTLRTGPAPAPSAEPAPPPVVDAEPPPGDSAEESPSAEQPESESTAADG